MNNVLDDAFKYISQKKEETLEDSLGSDYNYLNDNFVFLLKDEKIFRSVSFKSAHEKVAFLAGPYLEFFNQADNRIHHVSQMYYLGDNEKRKGKSIHPDAFKNHVNDKDYIFCESIFRRIPGTLSIEILKAKYKVETLDSSIVWFEEEFVTDIIDFSDKETIKNSPLVDRRTTSDAVLVALLILVIKMDYTFKEALRLECIPPIEDKIIIPNEKLLMNSVFPDPKTGESKIFAPASTSLSFVNHVLKAEGGVTVDHN